MKEDLEEAIPFKSKQDLIDHLKSIGHLEKYKEYALVTDDGYDCYILWARNRMNAGNYPIIQIDYDGDTIFHREGTEENIDILAQAINKLEESKRVRETYTIVTIDGQGITHDQRRRAHIISQEELDSMRNNMETFTTRLTTDGRKIWKSNKNGNLYLVINPMNVNEMSRKSR